MLLQTKGVMSIVLAMAFAVLSLSLFPPLASADTVFLGDSRTSGMYDAVYGTSSREVAEVEGGDDTVWRAKPGAGYEWMDTIALDYAEKHISPGDVVVFLFGVNDTGNADLYAGRINECAAAWKGEGVSTMFVSALPVDDTVAESFGYWHRDGAVLAFNERMRSSLTDDVKFLDLYSRMGCDFETFDGLHFRSGTYKEIYSEVMAAASSLGTGATDGQGGLNLAEESALGVSAESRPDAGVESDGAPGGGMRWDDLVAASLPLMMMDVAFMAFAILVLKRPITSAVRRRRGGAKL